ncbi:nitroreductase family protein [Demetria terragena]|uniref:nitroreductase family protein n=1 Tax=Demetria terragena TaxID=63959 RepID=UPI0003A9EF75|nr:nitroreductase family protein [Demetria terragena]
METQRAIRARRMIRQFDPDRPVDPQALHRILTLALRAPSAGFSQGWDFVLLTAAQDREAFWSAATDSDVPDSWLRGVMSAPALVVCCSDKAAYLERYAQPDKGWTDQDDERWPVPYWDIDVGMAALIMLLVAVDEDLGALFFGAHVPTHAAVKNALAIPVDRTIVGIVALGYPQEKKASGSVRVRRRRPTEEVVHHGRFGMPYDPVQPPAKASE